MAAGREVRWGGAGARRRSAAGGPRPAGGERLEGGGRRRSHGASPRLRATPAAAPLLSGRRDSPSAPRPATGPLSPSDAALPAGEGAGRGQRRPPTRRPLGAAPAPPDPRPSPWQPRAGGGPAFNFCFNLHAIPSVHRRPLRARRSAPAQALSRACQAWGSTPSHFREGRGLPSPHTQGGRRRHEGERHVRARTSKSTNFIFCLQVEAVPKSCCIEESIK